MANAYTADPVYLSLKAMAGELRGERMPGERSLSERLGVARARVRVALAALEAEGLIYRRHGSGTFAVDRGNLPSGLKRVAVVIDPTLKLGDDPFFSLVVDRLQELLQALGAECLLMRADGEQPDGSFWDGQITLGVAGLSLIAHWHEPLPPVVGLFIESEGTRGKRVSTLQLEDEQAGRAAGERLIATGCEHVLFFGRRSIPMVENRQRGAATVLAAAGIGLDGVECSLNYAAGMKAIREAELPADGKFGVIAANDWLAVGLHAGLLARDDGAIGRATIVSFDGLPLAADPSLGIASLVAPVEAMTRDAIEEIRRLGNLHAPGRKIRYTLQWRE